MGNFPGFPEEQQRRSLQYHQGGRYHASQERNMQSHEFYRHEEQLTPTEQQYGIRWISRYHCEIQHPHRLFRGLRNETSDEAMIHNMDIAMKWIHFIVQLREFEFGHNDISPDSYRQYVFSLANDTDDILINQQLWRHQVEKLALHVIRRHGSHRDTLVEWVGHNRCIIHQLPEGLRVPHRYSRDYDKDVLKFFHHLHNEEAKFLHQREHQLHDASHNVRFYYDGPKSKEIVEMQKKWCEIYRTSEIQGKDGHLRSFEDWEQMHVSGHNLMHELRQHSHSRERRESLPRVLRAIPMNHLDLTNSQEVLNPVNNGGSQGGQHNPS